MWRRAIKNRSADDSDMIESIQAVVSNFFAGPTLPVRSIGDGSGDGCSRQDLLPEFLRPSDDSCLDSEMSVQLQELLGRAPGIQVRKVYESLETAEDDGLKLARRPVHGRLGAGDFGKALLMPCAVQQPAQPGEATAGGAAAAAAEAATGGTAAGAAAAEVKPAEAEDQPQASGAGRDGEVGAGNAGLPPPPMHDPEVNLDALRRALDAACSKASADKLDMGPSAWSRQSTEVEGIEELLGAFSRQSTGEPWPSLDEAEASISKASWPDVARRLGIERSVVRTSLEFREVGAARAATQRALSTN